MSSVDSRVPTLALLFCASPRCGTNLYHTARSHMCTKNKKNTAVTMMHVNDGPGSVSQCVLSFEKHCSVSPAKNERISSKCGRHARREPSSSSSSQWLRNGGSTVVDGQQNSAQEKD
eukprot:scaffold3256_cov150-Amphora_coffeaeformis.AAC.3